LIEFRWSKVDKKNNNTPILKDAEIDELAEMVMHDYKPQLLKDPAPIDHLHFLEFYLGANVRFMDIYYDEKPIWGATAFNDEEYIRVFDRDNTCIRAEKLNNRTIVIDNYVHMGFCISNLFNINPPNSRLKSRVYGGFLSSNTIYS
jgi:hypothetical protein